MDPGRREVIQAALFAAVAAASPIGLLSEALAADLSAVAGLRDGRRMELRSGAVYLLDRYGRRRLAPNGAYTFRDGGSVNVQNGRLVSVKGTPTDRSSNLSVAFVEIIWEEAPDRRRITRTFKNEATRSVLDTYKVEYRTPLSPTRTLEPRRTLDSKTLNTR